jgi:hypothetical protein
MPDDDFPHNRLHIRLWSKAGDLTLDFAFGLVPSVLKKARMILARQVWSKERDGRERDGTLPKLFENEWKLARRPRGLYAVIRRMLRQMKHLCAVGEQRRAALTQVESARIEFG